MGYNFKARRSTRVATRPLVRCRWNWFDVGRSNAELAGQSARQSALARHRDIGRTEIDGIIRPEDLRTSPRARLLGKAAKLREGNGSQSIGARRRSGRIRGGAPTCPLRAQHRARRVQTGRLARVFASGFPVRHFLARAELTAVE